MTEHESLHVQQKQMSRYLFAPLNKTHICQLDDEMNPSFSSRRFAGFQGFARDINLHAGLETRNMDLLVLLFVREQFGYNFNVLFVKYKQDSALWHGVFKLSLS